MASPFSIFRKHQKSLMVVLVIGSMIAFTGESLFTADGPAGTLLGLLLGLGLALVAGFQFGRPMEYAIGGAIIGAVLGFAAPKFISGGGIQSELGVFDEQRMTDMISKRTAANSFVGALRRKAVGFDIGGAPFTLAYQDIQLDTMLGEVLRAEADEMGIYIDDDAVNEFINKETMDRLKPEDFVDIRSQLNINNMPVSEKDLYNLLRDEIKAKVALQALAPFGDRDAVTPDKYWDLYQRMNTRQQLAFAPVPVDSFLSQVGEPSDEELQTLFEKYRDKLPNLEPGSPGFYQAPRMKLAYIEADYATVAATIADPTEEEIKQFYEDNKEQFKEESVPDDPEEPTNDLKTLEELEAELKAEAAAEAAGNEGEEKPAESTEPENSEANEEEKAGEGDGGCEPWQEESAQAGEDQKPVENTAPAPAALPAPPLSVPQVSDDEPAGADPFKVQPATYMPLDADLKEQIKRTLKNNKTNEEIKRLIDAGYEEMKRLSGLRDDKERASLDVEDLDMTDFDVQLCKDLKTFADGNGLSYAETPLATGRELLDRQEFPIGSAVPPNSQFAQQRPLNVVQKLFSAGSPPLFVPDRAELVAYDFDQTVNQFAYWAIGQVPAHEPKGLDEAGIREQVTKAWKREQARPLAEARAKELAKMVNAGLADQASGDIEEMADDETKTMSDILENITEDGSANTPKLVVTDSLPFSWMRTSSAPNPMGFAQQTAALTQIDGVQGVTDDFMRVIFQELKSNEAGVAVNYDRSVYYVAQPLNRFPSDEADLESARERFAKTKHFEFNSPMPGLVRQQYGVQNRNWIKRLEKKYNIDFGLL